MHTIIRVLFTCVLAAAALPGLILAAPLFQSSVELRSLALSAADLPDGFTAVPDRTVSEERPDGVAVYDVTFVRERTPANLGAGAYETRSGVARTARTEDAIQQFASTREAFAAEGWKDVSVPPLGDESAGLSLTTEGDGGSTASHSYLFRKGPWILMIGLRGRPDATKIEDAVAMAIVVSQRVDRALGASQPEATSGAPSGAPSATRTRAPLTERLRVISPGGANVRAEPSLGAVVLVEAPEGLIVEVAGANRDAEGRTWRNVRLSDGRTGWIASTLVETLAPTPAPAASPMPPAAASPSPSVSAPATPAAAQPETPESSTELTEEPASTTDVGQTDQGAVAPPDGGPGAPDAAAETPAVADAVAEPVPAATPATATPAATTPAPASAAAASNTDNTVRATGAGGLAIEVTLRETSLSSGSQQVRVLVTRNGQPVPDARVDVTARLDPRRYRAVNAPRTGSEGRSEVEWAMEGPAGDYEVVVEVRPDDSASPTTATARFRWQ